MAGSFNAEQIREMLRAYFIMGSVNCPGQPAEVLRQAIAGGITLFQYREKGKGALQGDARLELARKLRRLCRASSVPFIVNDDIELALAVDADGVHVGQEDEPASNVRRRIGPGMLLGVSAHDAEEAERAVREGADYLGVGPIYATGSKEDAKAPAGPEVITRIREAGIRVPIVGIGGITAGNAAEVVRAGADGVSVISAISLAANPAAAASELLDAVRKAIFQRQERG
ncbi:thiamine-phosphate pyrophosphorylase [Gordoniibacillus kamchatkensis]|uniref:Thiamine-phosphate synthase n=1 Tax=Gordoniibacillus kamchatkensis TaxID=1590651 RepID=A0ABR5AMJ1_9BACL|nr:thiamine phosphate synthase [Paenibacillus sp. VKM B-2647]KIL42254.1 thiamine-phosphate pyrophosphorylase [Paenibacillus sp. VKM B-2647]